MKKITFVMLICISTSTISSQIANNSITDSGDIAIVAYHDNPDGFSFVLLDDCPDTTSIKFIDEEWTGSSFASATTEGEVTWTNNTGATIVQGTIIHIENANDNSPGILASAGTASETDGGFSLDLQEDEILAITGTRSSFGTFLTYFGDVDSVGSTLSGTSLVDGTNAIYQETVTEGYYSGPDNCTNLSVSDCAKQINNISNWTFGSYTYPDDIANQMTISGVLSSNTIQKKKLIWYPSPTNDFIQIKNDEAILNLEIFDSKGVLVLKKQSNQATIKLNVIHLNQGLYFVKIYSKLNISTFQFLKTL